MNAFVMIEGTKAYPDAKPIGGFASDAERRYDAERGSRRLRNAIWKLQGYKPPKAQRVRAPRAKIVREPIIKVPLCPTCFTPVGPKRQLIADIQQAVAAYYGFSTALLTSDDRRREITRARQQAMYLASELTVHSVAEIGRRFKRDHTTVLHAIKEVNRRCEEDFEEAFNVSVLRERLAA